MARPREAAADVTVLTRRRPRRFVLGARGLDLKELGVQQERKDLCVCGVLNVLSCEENLFNVVSQTPQSSDMQPSTQEAICSLRHLPKTSFCHQASFETNDSQVLLKFLPPACS